MTRRTEQDPAPATLPADAWGPRPIDWNGARAPVWVWVQWHDRVAEKRRGYVKGSNDRVCVVWVDGPGGGREIVVFRGAVTHRRETTNAPDQHPRMPAGG